MAIQDVINNCCEGLKNGATVAASYASTSAQWVGRTVTTAGQYMLDGAQKAAEFTKPYFANVMAFAKENQTSLLIGVVCAALGAAAYAVFSGIFCKNETPPVVPPVAQTV